MSKFFILFLLVLSGNALASPDISVGTLYDYMSAEKTTLLKRIRNIGDETAFVSGALQDGERIVTLGAHTLREGEAIQPLDASAPVALDVAR